MTIRAKYAHTNLVAQDWKLLAAFYEQILGCTPVPPERDLKGPWLDAVTGVPGAEIRGAHLKLPGYGDEGPTLEILQYSQEAARPETASNRPGFTHIAFEVDDVEAAKEAVLSAGGGTVGEIVSLEIAGAGVVTLAYLTDPEGNIIELQRWSR